MMDLGTPKHYNNAMPAMFSHRMSAIALTACVGLLAGISSAGADTDIKVTQKASASAGLAGHHGTINSSRLIVRSNDKAALETLVTAIGNALQGVSLGRTLDSAGTAFIVNTPDIESAIAVQKLMIGQDGVRSVRLDQERASIQRPAQTNGRRIILPRNRPQSTESGIGIRSLPIQPEAPRGGSGDADFIDQWHFFNNPASGGYLGFADRDNNITTAIYDTLGYTGAGVVVGVPASGLNVHIDLDHLDLVNKYDLSLSMLFDADTPPGYATTGWAGIVGAERGNTEAGQGVAPGATLSTFRWGTASPLIEFEAYDWLNQDVDIKFYRVGDDYTFPGGVYNNGHVNDYVMAPFLNSIRFGRSGNGTVHVYGTGVGRIDGDGNINFLPDPYTFTDVNPDAPNSFSPIDQLEIAPNVVALGLTNAYTSGPYYITGSTNNYPPAMNRRSLIINTVAEDGNFDIYAAQGTSVFASVYGGTNNIAQSLSQADPDDNVDLRGVLTTVPNLNDPDPGDSGFVPFAAGDAPFSATTTGPAIASGIVALMLEANPDLTLRDIQHILFESIQDSTRADNIKWPNYDLNRIYYAPFPFLIPPFPRNFWQTNSGLYNSDTTVNQAIRHSDNYGFGMIDAELAVEKAVDWAGAPKLFLLDSGIVGDIGGGTNTDDPRVDQEILDAEWVEFIAVDGSTGTQGESGMVVFASSALFNFCVRQNIIVEAIVVELSIKGEGSNDLYINMISPSGTRSILAMPTTLNTTGSADDENLDDDDRDQGFGSGNVGGDDFAYYQHPFLTWKHWGEKAGGVWSIEITDYGPDEITPEGAEAGDDPMTNPGADMITTLGEIGIPGSAFRSAKELSAFRIKIYGYKVGLDIFEGCNPFTTSCPADLNGDGIVNTLDLQIYIDWYITRNALADLNADGAINLTDLFIFRGIWAPGYCTPGGVPRGGGRPGAGGTNVGDDNDPVTSPI